MWAHQGKTGDHKGAWPWLDFGNEPFEATESVYYGAALAVGTTPEHYRSTQEIQDNLKLLADYIPRVRPPAPSFIKWFRYGPPPNGLDCSRRVNNSSSSIMFSANSSPMARINFYARRESRGFSAAPVASPERSRPLAG